MRSMFSQLGDKLQDIFKDLRGHGSISEANISDAMRQVRLALLEADVDYQVAKNFVARIREKALGESHPAVANNLQDLADVYSDQRRYSDAEGLRRRALAIYEQALGTEHRETITVGKDYQELLQTVQEQGTVSGKREAMPPGP